MLIIRNAQMAALQECAQRVFAAKLVPVLRAGHRERVAAYADHELEEALTRAVGRAQHYGLTRDGDVLRYAVMLVVVGEYFDLYPKFHDILHGARHCGGPALRLIRLMEVATESDWSQAACLSEQLAATA